MYQKFVVNLKKISLKSPNFYLPVGIGIIAVIVRILAAFKMAWRPDEIVYVDWIGQWFTTHFFSYFFQFFHNNYPPQSDVFGNPPLAMWVMTAGIAVAKFFGIKILLGARLVNVILGGLTTAGIFFLGKKWFGSRVGLAAALAFALLPIAVANNGTAYLETLLTLLLLVAFELFIQIIEKNKKIAFVWLGIVLGLAFLTKFVVIPIIVTFLILLPIFRSKRKFYRKGFFYCLLITIILPVILWSGLRDFSHVSGIVEKYQTKAYSAYPIFFKFSIIRYYFFMLVGILPPIVIFSFVGVWIYLLRRIILDRWQKYKKEISLLIIILVYIGYSAIFVGYSASHQLLPIIPFILILAAIGWVCLFDFLKIFWLKLLLCLLILLCLILPLTSFRPEFWAQYSSILVGGPDRSFKLYVVGAGGEGVPEVADWLNKNIPENSRIAVVAYDWLFKKYLINRTAAPLFLDEGSAGALTRGADFVVLPRQYMNGETGKTATELLKLQPIYSYSEKGIVMANVYKVEYLKTGESQAFDLNDKDVVVKKLNGQVEYKINNGELDTKFKFEGSFNNKDHNENRFIIMHKKKFDLRNFKSITMDLCGDGDLKPISVIMAAEDGGSFLFNLGVDWVGYKRLVIPFELFYYQPAGLIYTGVNLSQDYNFNLGLSSKTPFKGEIKMRNISLEF